MTKVDIGELKELIKRQPDLATNVAHGMRIILTPQNNLGDYASFIVYGPEEGTPEIIMRKDELLRFAKEVISKFEPGALAPGVFAETPGRSQEDIDAEVGRRVDEYRKYWNAESGKFEIDVGTPSEWICTEDELYDDVRKSVEQEGM